MMPVLILYAGSNLGNKLFIETPHTLHLGCIIC